MADSRNESVALPMQHLRLALRMFGGAAETVERLLTGTGLHQMDMDEPDLALPASALLTICDNVAEMVGEDWFLNLPILWSTDAHSELGLAMRVAPDFRAAIDVMSEFAQYRWPIMHLERRDDRANIVITLELLLPVSRKNRYFAMCVAFLSFQTIVNAMLIQKANAIRYEFEGDPPPYAARLAELFSGKVSWGHGRSTITIPQDLAVQVSPMASPVLFTTLLRALRKIASDQGQKQPMISQKVAITLDNVTLGRLDAEEVAQRIGISRRTLERRLREEGTSFRELSNTSLKQRLEQALRDPAISAESMAEKLGFHDASSLLRASRRLFGASLSQLRREAKSDQTIN